eukprot:gene23760-28805_t
MRRGVKCKPFTVHRAHLLGNYLRKSEGEDVYSFEQPSDAMPYIPAEEPPALDVEDDDGDFGQYDYPPEDYPPDDVEVLLLFAY